MILQHMILPGSGLKNTELLYSTSYVGDFPIRLLANTSVDFFGFFNFLSLDKWCKYVDATRIFLNIDGSGLVDVEFTLFTKNKTYVPCVVSVDLSQTHYINIPEINHGLLGIKIFAKSNADIFSLNYYSDVEGADVFIGIDLCTYNRKEFVDLKVKAFKQSLCLDSCFSKCIELYIIDNASSIPLNEYNLDNVHIIHNKNTGGSGGFIRGIREINKTNKFTHVLLMDDDTIVEPETLFRSWTFLKVSFIKNPEIIVSGAMISIDDPYLVVESSSTFREGHIFPNNQGLNLSFIQNCIKYNQVVESNYAGWWYCIYPLSYANNRNLPLQLFLKMDDVEYGVRSNMPVITLNGISVWHLDFYKKYSTIISYYDVRNLLVVCDTLGEINLKLKLTILKKIVSEIFCLKYKNAALSLRGIHDYLKGYYWIANQDAELHNSLMDHAYIFVNTSQKLPENVSVQNHSLLYRILTLNGIFLKYECDLPVNTVSTSKLYGVKKVRYYNSDGESFTESRQPLVAIKLLSYAVYLFFKI